MNTSKRTNLQMIPHKHKDMSSVKNYQVDTLPMCTSTKYVFEEQMKQDSVLASLQAPITDAKDKEMLALITRSLLVDPEELLNRQLRGKLANPSSEVIVQ